MPWRSCYHVETLLEHYHMIETHKWEQTLSHVHFGCGLLNKRRKMLRYLDTRGHSGVGPPPLPEVMRSYCRASSHLGIHHPVPRHHHLEHLWYHPELHHEDCHRYVTDLVHWKMPKHILKRLDFFDIFGTGLNWAISHSYTSAKWRKLRKNLRKRPGLPQLKPQ